MSRPKNINFQNERGFIPLKKVAIGLGILVFCVLIYSLVNNIINSFKSEERLNQELEELHLLEVDNKKLKERLKQVQSVDFIEKVARDKLGLGKEGEVVVVIPEETIEAVLGSKREEEEVKYPNWQGWLKVFLPNLF